MKKQRWQDWVKGALGLWIFISPRMIQHTMAPTDFWTTTAVTPAVMWNMYLVGIAIFVLAAAAVIASPNLKDWSNLALVMLGGWLLISPLFLGFSSATALMWNAVIAGVIVVALASWAIVTAVLQEQSL